jgi:hypothetical protein
MTVESAFAKVIGREPSEKEREHLYRVRDALGLSENDAFWYIVITLEHYDALYREYPRIIEDAAARTIESAREAFAAAARLEAARAEQMLAQKVAETSVAIAKKLAEKPVGIDRVTGMFAAVVLFGSTCMAAGYQLAAGEKPFWATRAATGSTGIAAVVLSAPAGWMIFLLLLPIAGYTGVAGYKRARDLASSREEQTLGWGLVGLAVAGTIACIVILSRII